MRFLWTGADRPAFYAAGRTSRPDSFIALDGGADPFHNWLRAERELEAA